MTIRTKFDDYLEKTFWECDFSFQPLKDEELNKFPQINNEKIKNFNCVESVGLKLQRPLEKIVNHYYYKTFNYLTRVVLLIVGIIPAIIALIGATVKKIGEIGSVRAKARHEAYETLQKINKIYCEKFEFPSSFKFTDEEYIKDISNKLSPFNPVMMNAEAEKFISEIIKLRKPIYNVFIKDIVDSTKDIVKSDIIQIESLLAKLQLGPLVSGTIMGLSLKVNSDIKKNDPKYKSGLYKVDEWTAAWRGIDDHFKKNNEEFEKHKHALITLLPNKKKEIENHIAMMNEKYTEYEIKVKAKKQPLIDVKELYLQYNKAVQTLKPNLTRVN